MFVVHVLNPFPMKHKLILSKVLDYTLDKDVRNWENTSLVADMITVH